MSKDTGQEQWESADADLRGRVERFVALRPRATYAAVGCAFGLCVLHAYSHVDGALLDALITQHSGEFAIGPEALGWYLNSIGKSASLNCDTPQSMIQ